MINKGVARELARNALSSRLTENDALFTPWAGLEVSSPRLVSDLAGRPSYWVVPLLCRRHTVGFVRVLSDGVVAAIGFTCRTPETPEECLTPDFVLTPQDVEEKFLHELSLRKGEITSLPMLVHDGPIGRESWLIKIRLNGITNRWIFVGRAGIYERAAGNIIGADSEIE